ncbi:MAG TPA: hypothetical protein VIP05_28665 [Burkholderiaceae bacterium]
MKLALSALAAAALAASSFAASAAGPAGYVLTRDHQAALQVAPAASKKIEYQNGPVMTDPNGVNVYVIWYGDWSNNTATTIVPDFFNHLGGSAWYNINSTYYDAANQHIANKVTLKKQTVDNYSHGSSLKNSAVADVVKTALANHSLPVDQNGVYFVLTSKDVKQGVSIDSFCTLYCGWHDTGSGTAAGKPVTIRYAFVGDAARCLSSCAAQSTSPNDNPGADGMISVIAHELSEAVTDPDTSSGWRFYSTDGNENADECAWTFGTEYTAPNGSMANVHLGTRDYLIQQNWVRGIPTEACAVGF